MALMGHAFVSLMNEYMIIKKSTIKIMSVATKTVIKTESTFYARMMRAQGARVYGPYHNGAIYVHSVRVA